MLVIDDDRTVANVVRRLLVARGHVVHLATCTKEAEEIWNRLGSDIDLVLCDVVMPDVRGPKLIERLAESEVKPQVLFMSGYNEEKTHFQLGHPVLAKPFSAEDLERALLAALSTPIRVTES